MAEKKPTKQKAELPSVDINSPEIPYSKRDHMMRGMNDQRDAFKKKYGEKWRNVANGILHVHSTHRKDYTADK
jgi:hypothetical protein